MLDVIHHQKWGTLVEKMSFDQGEGGFKIVQIIASWCMHSPLIPQMN